jgi:hypothetical protein
VRAQLAYTSGGLVGDLVDQHKKAADAAAGVATLRWRLGEPAAVIRKWLDRLAMHVSVHWQLLARSNHPGIKLLALGALGSYFTLERRMLPPELVRPMPQYWQWIAAGSLPGGGPDAGEYMTVFVADARVATSYRITPTYDQ